MDTLNNDDSLCDRLIRRTRTLVDLADRFGVERVAFEVDLVAVTKAEYSRVATRAHAAKPAAVAPHRVTVNSNRPAALAPHEIEVLRAGIGADRLDYVLIKRLQDAGFHGDLDASKVVDLPPDAVERFIANIRRLVPE